MSLFERPAPEMGTEGAVVWRRAFAVLVDTILVTIATSALVGVLARGRLAFLGSAGALLLSLGYYSYFEGAYGQTLGKMAFDVVVVTEDGDAVDYGPAVVRTVLRVVDALPVLYLVGLLVIQVTEREQRIGDLVADTVVVRTRDAELA